MPVTRKRRGRLLTASGMLEKRLISWGYNMGTIIVGLVLVVIVGLAVRSMVKDKKAGKSIQCGGDCKHCGGGHCH